MQKKIMVNYEIVSPNEELNENGKIEFFYDNFTTFNDLMKKLNVPCLSTISEVPELGHKLSLVTFDYILGDDTLYWNIPIFETKIVDYLNTFHCEELFVVSADGIGCPDFLTLECSIEIAEEIISNLWAVAGAIGTLVTIKEIISYVTSYIRKEHDEHNSLIAGNVFFYSILSRDDWKISEFCAKYNIETNQAEAILSLLGYNYNLKNDAYHITKKKRKQIVKAMEEISDENLSKICGIEIGE